MFKEGHTPWNKGLTKETDKRLRISGQKISVKNKGKSHPQSEESKKKISLSKIGDKNPAKRPEVREKIRKSVLKYMDNDEVRKHMSETHFVYGCNQYWHEKAWNLFGKEYCEICGMSNEESKFKNNERLSMHNTLMPKDYIVMEPEAWMCLCKGCHKRLELRWSNENSDS